MKDGGKAVPVAPKPSANRMVRVVCPMCESPGFIPEAAQGQDVRCWKKSCPLPVYKAPLPEAEPEPEPEKGGAPVGLIATVLGVLALAGGGYYVWQNQGPDEDPGRFEMPAIIAEDDPEAADGEPQGSGLITQPTVVEKPPEFRPLTEIAAESRSKIASVARDRDIQDGASANRRAAEALALAGQFDAARKQLAAIPKSLAYFQVGPLATIAQTAIARGDRQTATAAADDALALAGRLPPTGRQPLDWSTRLAESLVRLGRTGEARDLIDRQHDAGLRGELSALWTGAADLGTYNLAATRRSSLVRDTANPQWLAVTRALVTDGQSDAAVEWARAAQSRSVRDDALTVWAGTLSRIDGRGAAEAAINGLSDVSPGLKARLIAAAGLARLEKSTEEVRETEVAVEAAVEATEEVAEAKQQAAGDQTEVAAAVTDLARDGDKLKAESQQNQQAAQTDADTLLQSAIAARGQADVPGEPLPLPSLRQFYDSRDEPNAGLPDADTIRTAALANLKIAELQHARGDDAAAWESIVAGLETLRTMTPSPVEMRAKSDEYRARKGALKRQLKQELRLSRALEEDQAFNRYRQQVSRIADAAEERLDLQEQFLAAALDWGLTDRVAQFVDASAALEPWDTTTIALRLGRPGQPRPDGRVPTLPSDQRLGTQVEQLVQAGDVRGLLALLRTERNDLETDLWSGIAAARWLEDGRRDAFLEFAANLQDEATVEQLLEVGSAQAAAAGTGPQLWNDLVQSEVGTWGENDWVAIYRGFASFGE